MADLREHLPGLEPERHITDWGRSERAEELADRTIYEFLYHYWFRVQVRGTEHLPLTGGGLLVANRAGVIPFDAAMIARAVREEHPRARRVHMATRQTISGIPGVGTMLMKLGVVGAHPDNLRRLLFDEQELVLAFPEGGAGPQKPVRERYRLREFTEPGYLAAAVSAAVPIIPVAVVGGEEAAPLMWRLGARLPVVPPLPLPAKFAIRFLPAIRSVPGEEELSGLLRRVRGAIQESLVEMLSERRSAWYSASS